MTISFLHIFMRTWQLFDNVVLIVQQYQQLQEMMSTTLLGG